MHCWLLVQGAPSGSVAVHAPGTPAATFAPLQLPTALEGHCESYQQGAPLRPTTAQYCAPLTIIVALDAQHLLSVAAAFGRPHAPSAHSALALQSAPGGAGGGAIGAGCAIGGANSGTGGAIGCGGAVGCGGVVCCGGANATAGGATAGAIGGGAAAVDCAAAVGCAAGGVRFGFRAAKLWAIAITTTTIVAKNRVVVIATISI